MKRQQRLVLAACLLLLASCSGAPVNDAKPATSQTATIEGSIRESGTEIPIAGASVFLVRPSNQTPVRTTTNADGHFALEGIEPGRHLVAIIREGYVVPGRQEISGYPFRVSAGQHISDAAFHMIPAGTVSGRVFGPDGKPANRVEVQLLQNLYVMGHAQWSAVNRGGSGRSSPVQTNERGEFRALGVDPGQYVIRFVPHEVSVEGVVPGGASPSPMLYPGARDVSRAAAVDVKPGRETLLDDVKLKNERRGWIRVTVVNESGEPLEGFGDWSVGPPGWIGAEYVLADQRVVNRYHEIQPDSPGTYEIVATWPRAAGRLTGTARVAYSGVDVDAKIVIRKPTSKLTGHVVLQETGGATRPVAGAEVAIGPKISYFARSSPEGTLLLPEVYAGRYQLGYVRGLPDDAFVVNVRQGSRDIFKDDLVIEGGETSLEVVVSPGAGVIQGKVVDAGGRPVHNALVALVPEPPLRDRKDYYGAYKDTRTDQNGQFEVQGITPGSYQTYAWADAPASAFRNDAYMKMFEGNGTPVKLDLGGKMTLELKALEVASK